MLFSAGYIVVVVKKNRVDPRSGQSFKSCVTLSRFSPSSFLSNGSGWKSRVGEKYCRVRRCGRWSVSGRQYWGQDDLPLLFLQGLATGREHLAVVHFDGFDVAVFLVLIVAAAACYTESFFSALRTRCLAVAAPVGRE